MKTIKIFLACSDELGEERQKFGNLIRRLDDIYIKRGVHLQLLVWEDMDPCYNNVRKQDEYNAWIRESDIFVCLFYTRAGQYTLEELEVAKEENLRRKEPMLMIYCRDLQPGEVEMDDLLEFKQRLREEFGHFWGHYRTTDKLHLDFVFLFMRTEECLSNILTVENGCVALDGFTVATMDNLPFAADNEGYQRMKAELEALPAKIEKTKLRVKKYPEDEEFRDELQTLIKHYNVLKEEFSNHQKSLFDTAKRISEMQLEKISGELQRAINEFEAEHVDAANAILNGIECEADRHIEQLDSNRKLVHQDIEMLHLKTKTMMTDLSTSIKQRIDNVLATYKKADDWAQRSALEKRKYALLLYDYGKFLYDYSLYDQALSVWQRECQMNEELYGLRHPKTAKSYNIIGYVYYRQENYTLSIEYHQKSLAIRESVLGKEHLDTATSYNNIGLVCYDLHKYAQALDYHQKAIAIREKVLGTMHQYTATSYNNIGKVYHSLGKYAQALEYHQKALAVRKHIFGADHPDIAKSYNNIGMVFYRQGSGTQALEYYQKALDIFENVLGIEHAYTAETYKNIGDVYRGQRNYNQALEYYHKALSIFEKVLPKGHSATQYIKESIKVLLSELSR